jgi:hypothetical protein
VTGVETYFSTLCRLFEATAAANGGSVNRSFQIADHPVRLRFATPALLAELTLALAHLRRPAGKGVPLEIMVWDGASAPVPTPTPPWSWLDYMSRGEIGGLDPDRFRAWFHVASGILSILDFDNGRALLCVRDARDLPTYEIAAPFRMILQAWLSRHGLHFAHAAAVGTDQGGVLLAGKGGSGKSTTSLACLAAGMAFISDDYCLITSKPLPRVHTVYCSAKTDDRVLKQIRVLGPSRQPRNDPAGEKALLLLRDKHAHQLVPDLPLLALLAPVVSDQETTTLEPVKALVAIRALAPTTLEQISGPDVSAWKTITSLARQLPCYRLRLGRDLGSAPMVISGLINKLTGAQA